VDHDQKPRILYIADPLCGWCYAFGYALAEAMDRFRDQCEFHVLLGGMVIGDREGPIGTKAHYILEALPRLEQTTGVVMGEAYKKLLREGDHWSSSLLPSKAAVAFRLLMPDRAMAFLHAVQHAHFQDAMDLNDPLVYAPIAAKCGVDEELFSHLLAEDRLTALAEEDFGMVRSWGISGFPSLAAEVGTRFYGLAHGYRTANELTQLIEAVLRVDPTSA
jgi:putative protein-disulfide isomerase